MNKLKECGAEAIDVIVTIGMCAGFYIGSMAFSCLGWLLFVLAATIWLPIMTGIGVVLAILILICPFPLGRW